MIYGIFYDTDNYCDVMAYPSQTEEEVREMLKIIAEDTITTNEEDGYKCSVQTIAKDGGWANLEFQKPDGSDQFYISLELVSRKSKYVGDWESVS